MSRARAGRTRARSVGLGLAALTWIAALVLAPYFATHRSSAALTFRAAAAAYLAGGAICHQRPERSFHLWGAQLPVCGRCSGLYAGAALGALGAAVVLGRSRFVLGRPRLVLLIAAVPTLVTFVLEWVDPGLSSNVARAAAGVPLGAAVAWIAGTAL